eukprot:COSAG02_NODE_144_length_34086_cov_65.390944_9_plen_51_part_00
MPSGSTPGMLLHGASPSRDSRAARARVVHVPTPGLRSFAEVLTTLGHALP